MASSVEKPNAQAWLLLAILVILYLLAAIDKGIISLLVEPIKAHFGLSDTQIGFLQGFGFFLIYAIAGLPAGYIIDKFSRIKLISGAVFFWSILTSLCGLAKGFWSLLFFRSGVAVAESALNPASFSLISDSFPPKSQGLALGIYISAAPIGAGLSILIGSLIYKSMLIYGIVTLPFLGALEPWQMTLMLLGAPGALFAIIVLMVKEPIRRHLSKTKSENPSNQTLSSFYKANKASMFFHHIGMSLVGIVMNGTMSWIAPFFARIHSIPASEIAGFGATPVMIGGIGVLFGGALSDYSAKFGEATRIKVCTFSTSLALIGTILYPILPNVMASAIALCVIVIFGGMTVSAGTTALQRVIPSQIRGAVSAFYLLIYGILAAIGPLAIGLGNDYFFQGPTGIKLSLAIISPVLLIISVLFFILAENPYAKSMAEIPE